MSLETRTLIAAAVSNLDGITCSKYYKQSAKAGTAMVRLAATRVDDTGFGWVETWQVLVVLPSDRAASEVWLDDMFEPLADALAEVLIVQSFTPTDVVFDSGATIPAVVIEGVRTK